MADSPTRPAGSDGQDGDSEGLRLYRSLYPGLTRGQLDVRDRPLYRRLLRAGLLHAIPLKRPFRPIADPLAYYREHYPGLTRGRLSKRDNLLYSRLRHAGLLWQVPTVHRAIPDPVAYYREHYPGLTRWQLHQRDCGLYQRLQRAGLLSHVPRQRTRKPRPVSDVPGTFLPAPPAGSGVPPGTDHGPPSAVPERTGS